MMPKNGLGESAHSLPPSLPDLRFHLTARPWRPLNTPRSEDFDRLEAAVRALAPFQYWNENDARDEKNGALIDPYAGKEVQYATPLFAFNVAALLSQGRAADLVTPGVRALDRAARNIAAGMANDHHGEFFIAPMVKARHIFESLQLQCPQQITPERLRLWKVSLKTPREVFMQLTVRQNWRTFAMKGEWLRQQDGDIADGREWIEACWTQEVEGGQRGRFHEDRDRYAMTPPFLLYHDRCADPETFAYNGAAAANLLDMLENGYDGPSAGDMRETLEHALRSSLLLLGGSGEAPAGGRTGEHVWNDSVYAAAFEMMAERARRGGDLRSAGQFRRAARLLLKSHARFQQEQGWFSITKNQFHPSLQHRYAVWSGLTNYNGFTQTCLAEALLTRRSEIAEEATPAEIGGYAVQLDPSFSAAFLNAGGMQAQICTRGETDAYGGVQWHALGITRLSRAGWDSRLGPGAGHVEPDFRDGVSFSPVFWENGGWTRVCRQPERFGGRFQAGFVHPLLVRGTLTIAPLPGQTGPTFDMRLTLTPDGIFVDTLRTSGTQPFGVLWPLLEFDGKTLLNRSLSSGIASASYPRVGGPEPDQQNFIALRPTHQLDAGSPLVRGGYGDLRPVRVTDANGGPVETFVYPRSANDPDAAAVRDSFTRDGQNFSSVLGRVEGTLSVGRTSAGGEGRAIDLDQDGRDDVTFDQPCAFILQLQEGRIVAAEVDRPVKAILQGQELSLTPFTPITLR